MSPRWEQRELPAGLVEHELMGEKSGASVTIDPGRRVAVISVAFVVPGTDEATIERCKRRAEDVLSFAQRGRS